MKKEKEQSSSEEQKAANENLLIRLNQNYGKLSKGQKRLADFISLHKEIYRVRTVGYEHTDIISKSERFFKICDEATGLAEVYAQLSLIHI